MVNHPASSPAPTRGPVIRIGIVVFAVVAGTASFVHGWRSAGDSKEGSRAGVCAETVREVEPLMAGASTTGASGPAGTQTVDPDTAQAMRRFAMTLVVQHPECFPAQVLDGARDLLDGNPEPS